MVHVPILRAGRPYRSLETTILGDVRTGEPVAEVSLANRGLIARDLLETPRFRQTLAKIPAADLIATCVRAARIFASDALPIDDGEDQTPERYLEQLSGTTGLPRALCRANMEKIRFVLENMETIIAGWTRGLDPGVLDAGFGHEEGRRVSFLPQADALGAVLPSNSPGVHSLWIPAFALKYPLVLKPGSREPWTPLRVQRALVASGAPPEAVSLYPSDHSGAAEILLRCGRSCLNASGVWTAAHGREIAEALAARLAAIEPRPLADPEAAIAAFSDPAQARRLSHHIDALLETPGAEDLTARCRAGGRIAELDGCTFLRPTVIWCDSPDHPLASSEYLFPFVAVVQLDQDEILDRIGSTLVATALTDDVAFRRDLMACRHIDRLNLGPIPTSRVSWDQPHEGNLFEHLYRQRALQTAGAA